MAPLSPVYLVSATRTPIGTFLGSLSELTAPQLGSIAIRAALERAHLPVDAVGEVFFGNVLSAGIGQAPARQSSLGAGISNSVPCTTINKVCGSGLQAVVFGVKTIALGDADVVVAGGTESMSNVPYYLKKARGGYRMGNGELVDGMIFDGLWDPYNNYHMGNAGELCASEMKISRAAQDEFATESYRRAIAAQKEGLFDAEIVPVEVPQKKGDPKRVTLDEEPTRSDVTKMGSLRAVFTKDGTITAANASKINDGASAVVLVSEKALKTHNLTPLARIVDYGSAAQAPEWFTTAPAKAIEVTMQRLGLSTRDIDLFEINEAFSVVALAVAQMCSIDLARVNVNGGAVALGHPIGASGARVLTTLVHAMKHRNAKRGLATLCIGGGEAVALVVERPLRKRSPFATAAPLGRQAPRARSSPLCGLHSGRPSRLRAAAPTFRRRPTTGGVALSGKPSTTPATARGYPSRAPLASRSNTAPACPPKSARSSTAARSSSGLATGKPPASCSLAASWSALSPSIASR